MNKIISVTSKGQTTIPAAMRRKLGLDKSGGVLQVSFNDLEGQLVIKKPADIDELSSRISSYIKPRTKPVTDVNAYYQKNRKANS